MTLLVPVLRFTTALLPKATTPTAPAETNNTNDYKCPLMTAAAATTTTTTTTATVVPVLAEAVVP